MADGFLGRWARRKEAVRKGQEVPPEPQVQAAVPQVPPPPPSPEGGGSEYQASIPPPPPGEGGGAQAAKPPPTLEDTEHLTPASDFTRFTRPDVAPEVKNAALRKLFTDPHFNTMDGLDVYIDDYSKPDPIPPAMLKRLASAQFLKLFDEEEKAKDEPQAGAAAAARDVADAPAAENVAQSGSRTEQALPPADEHADPDLRLQQDDAPGPAGPGARAR